MLRRHQHRDQPGARVDVLVFVSTGPSHMFAARGGKDRRIPIESTSGTRAIRLRAGRAVMRRWRGFPGNFAGGPVSIGLRLHRMVLAMAVIILLAVGSDYNLLLVARFNEEIHAGLKSGIIGVMGGSGSAVMSAGLVFAITMAALGVSELRIFAQVGTTIGLGLLFDTLVIRSFMTPSIAALLGRRFWSGGHRRCGHSPPGPHGRLSRCISSSEVMPV
jgi:MMPL family